MSLTAVNTVSMETPTTALAYISGSSPSLHSPTAPLPLPPSLSLSLPAAQPPQHSPEETEGLWLKRRGGRGDSTEGKLAAADRKKKRTFIGEQKQGWKSTSSGLAVCGAGGPLLYLRLVRRLRRGTERVIKRYQFETVSRLSFFALLYLANMNICIYSCCAVGQRTAAADLLSKSSCLHVFNYYNYLNL